MKILNYFSEMTIILQTLSIDFCDTIDRCWEKRPFCPLFSRFLSCIPVVVDEKALHLVEYCCKRLQQYEKDYKLSIKFCQ